MKTCSVGTELFLAGGQANMMELMVTFHNFVNVLKNDLTLYEIKVHLKDAALWVLLTPVTSEMTQKICFLCQN